MSVGQRALQYLADILGQKYRYRIDVPPLQETKK